MKYSCYGCHKKKIYTELKKSERFISEDGRILCKECSIGEVPVDINLFAKTDIAHELNEKLRLKINSTQEINLIEIGNELTYSFEFEGKKYQAKYNKDLQETEILILE